MNADIVGALEQLEKSWQAFEHKGKPMTKEQVREVLVYGIKKGYKTTGELSDEEVDLVIGALVELNCMACGKSCVVSPPEMCCNGKDCGCMGMPIDSVVCSQECNDRLLKKHK